jgi:hypothetical protein
MSTVADMAQRLLSLARHTAFSSGWSFLVAPFAILWASSPASEDELETTPVEGRSVLPPVAFTGINKSV